MFKNMKLKLVIPFLLISFNLVAQFTVKGRVVDENKQPMPFVNTFIQGTTYGTTTDDDGRFSFICKKRTGILEISSMGFQTQTFKVNSRTKPLNIVLREGEDVLDEVVIVSRPKKRLKKKENPAYKILKEFWKRKRKMGVKQTETYQYRKHTITEVGLNNIDSAFIRTLFNEQYGEIMKEIQFDSDGINYYIPINIHEKVSKVYGNNKLKKVRTDIEAEKKEGFKADGFVFDRLSNTFKDIDVFKNDIAFLGKSFVSPFSKYGFATYDYLLYDSIVRDNKKLYNIYYFPIRNADFAFQGNFWIADKDFSVRKVNMKVTKDAGVNFIREITFTKEFKIKNDSIYLPTKNVYDGDFTFFDKSDNQKGLTIKQTDIFSHYNLSKKYPDKFYDFKDKKIRPKQYFRDEKYWTKLDSKDYKETYDLIKSVKGKRKIRNLTKTINILSTGYLNLPNIPVQVGDLWSLLNYNQVEGLRIKLSLRTFKTKDDRLKLSGFFAYGLKNKETQYGVFGNYLLSYQPRITVGAYYQNSIQQLGGGFSSSGTSSILSRGNNYFLSNVHKGSARINYFVTDNFDFGISFSKANITSATTDDKFSVKYLDDDGNIQSNVVDVVSDLYIAYSPGRRVYGLGVSRRSGREPYPSLSLAFRHGYKGVFGGTHDYNKIQFQYSHPILLGKFGIARTTFQASKTFGKVPLLLLNPVPANQSYSLVPNTFALMNYYDYITDAYMSLHLEHHFNGFILNRIPLIQKLKWRSLATFRMVYGSISDKNIEINKSNISYNAPTDKPYYEYGVGIENIGWGNFRFFRIDAIWRGDYTPSLNNIAKPTPKFGFRIGLQTEL